MTNYTTTKTEYNQNSVLCSMHTDPIPKQVPNKNITLATKFKRYFQMMSLEKMMSSYKR